MDKKDAILIISDKDYIHQEAFALFEYHYNLINVYNTKDAAELLTNQKIAIDMILLDITATDALFLILKEKNISVPIVGITDTLNTQIISQIFNFGVLDVIEFPISPIVANNRLKNILKYVAPQRREQERQYNYDHIITQQYYSVLKMIYTCIYQVDFTKNECKPLFLANENLNIPAEKIILNQFFDTFQHLVPEDQKEEYYGYFSKENILNHFKTIDKPLSREIQAKNRSGEYEWITITFLKPQMEKNNDIILCCFSNTNIKNKEAKNKTVEHLLSNIPAGIIILERKDHLRVIYCNDCLCNIFGETQETIQNRCKNQEIPFLQYPQEVWTKHINTDIPYEKEASIVRSDGTTKWLWSSSMILQEPNKDCISYTIVKDITAAKERQDQIHFEEERFRILAKNCNDVLFDINCFKKNLILSFFTPEGRIEEEYPFSREFLNDNKYISKASASQLIDTVKKIEAGENIGNFEFDAKFFGSSYRNYRGNYICIQNHKGEYNHILGRAQDVTKEKLTEENLRREQNRHTAMFPDCLYSFEYNTINDTSEMIYENKDRKSEFFPYQRYLSSKKLNLVHPKDRVRLLKTIKNNAEYKENILKSESSSLIEQFQILSRNNEWIWVEISVHPSLGRWKDSNKFICYVSDISSAKQQEMKIISMARTDSVTSLRNRHALEEEITAALEESASVPSCFMVIDLDYFKKINDTYGHLSGDKALKQFANILRKTFRESDIIGRYGGDEFIVFLQNIRNGEILIPKLKLLISRTEGLMSMNHWDIPISCSIGISSFPQHGESFESLLLTADKALYQGKKSGKNQFIFYSETEKYK